MSRKPLWNSDKELDKSNWDLVTEDKERPGHARAGGQTCLANASGIQFESWICSVF
jgi:hypothetical protein